MAEFKKGDIVKIMQPTDDQKKRSKWSNDHMNSTVGKLGTITNRSLDGVRWAVIVEGEDKKWHYCEDVLKPIKKWQIKKAKKKGLLKEVIS